MSAAFDALAAQDAAHIMPTYARYPLAFSHGQGATLFDLDGKPYLDLLSGIAVTALGHAHPEIAQVLAEQALRLTHVSNLCHHPQGPALAEKLLSTCAAGKVFFANSGAEANEGAIKLARRFQRKVRGREAYKIVTLEGSFHGRTLATLTATGQDKIKDGFGPLPEGFVTIPFNDPAALEAAMGPDVAAVMVEMIQGEIGVRPLSPEFVAALARLREKHGFLLIIDEIQTGLCRTGNWWAHQGYGLAPDIFTVAKPLANGLPMGAVLATDEAAKGFAPGSHGTTFGGGPLLCAVALKVLEIMERDGLAKRAAEVGAHFKARLEGLAAALPDKAGAVRGQGLMLALDLLIPGKPVWKALLDAGYLVNLVGERTFRFLPPLNIEPGDLDRFADDLEKTLRAA
jgi:acetylornithine/N-succinyldiaminopimelate aminotransferase